jgi:hypothetical protein
MHIGQAAAESGQECWCGERPSGRATFVVVMQTAEVWDGNGRATRWRGQAAARAYLCSARGECATRDNKRGSAAGGGAVSTSWMPILCMVRRGWDP